MQITQADIDALAWSFATNQRLLTALAPNREEPTPMTDKE